MEAIFERPTSVKISKAQPKPISNTLYWAYTNMGS